MKVMKVISALLVLMAFSSVFAQDTTRCGTDVLLEQQLNDPEFERSYFKLQKEISKHQRSLTQRKSLPNLPVTVPVIVHVIHEGEPYGTGNHLTTEFVQETIDNANQNFAGEFSDDPTANTQINFCIANNSVDGDPIDGIRYYDWNDLYSYDIGTFPDGFLNDVNLANLIGYDRQNYCNIYVLDWGGNPLGFAYLPSADYGVYMNTNFFGLTSGNYGQNRTLVHELGHYCGLYHTFHFTQNCGPETNCESQGDRVCDTPPTTGNYGCPTNGGACGDDLVNNYMDYTNDGCMDSFTQGQSLRMLSSLEVSRPGVVNNILACGVSEGIDISVGGIVVPLIGCNEILEGASFQLNNFGDTITEVLFEYDINGNLGQILWEGSLAFGESTTITIPDVEVGFGDVNIIINALLDTDINQNNDTISYEFNNYEGVEINIQIDFDALPAGIDWNLYQAIDGEPVGEPIFEAEYEITDFNNLYSCESVSYNFCLEEGEYVVVMTDLFGNGLNYPFCDGNEDSGDFTILNGNDTLNYVFGGWDDSIDLPFIVEIGCPPLGDCPWDINGDGIVNNPDILKLLEEFGLEGECLSTDFNQDGVVGVDDILDFINYFGYYCNGGISVMDNLIEGSGAMLYKTMDVALYENGNYITHSELYDLQGREISKDKIYLPEGIYVVKQYWDNGFITTKKLYLNTVE
jgi:hypothetical protein